jgi:hypothetical protein
MVVNAEAGFNAESTSDRREVTVQLSDVGMALNDALEAFYNTIEDKERELLPEFIFAGIDIMAQIIGVAETKEIITRMLDCLPAEKGVIH